MQLHAGEALLIFGKNLRQHVNTGGFVGGNDDFTAGNTVELGDFVLGAPPGVDHLFCIAGKNFARGGERDTASETLEELGVKLLLELADLRADGWLGAVAGLGSFGEAF